MLPCETKTNALKLSLLREGPILHPLLRQCPSSLPRVLLEYLQVGQAMDSELSPKQKRGLERWESIQAIPLMRCNDTHVHNNQ